MRNGTRWILRRKFETFYESTIKSGDAGQCYPGCGAGVEIREGASKQCLVFTPQRGAYLDEPLYNKVATG